VATGIAVSTHQPQIDGLRDAGKSRTMKIDTTIPVMAGQPDRQADRQADRSVTRLPADTGMAGCPFHRLRQRLRGAGLRPTRQRVSLGWLLFAKGDRHLSAEMLFEEAARARVSVSLATVYNTLHQFTEAGLLRELAMDGGKTFFDTNPTDHHHFFVEGEEAMIDVPVEAVAIGALPEPPEGMEIARVDVIMRLRRKQD
jgi:Fur family iron response transcriptional regulator